MPETNEMPKRDKLLYVRKRLIDNYAADGIFPSTVDIDREAESIYKAIFADDETISVDNFIDFLMQNGAPLVEERPIKPPLTFRVNIDIYFAVKSENFPSWATELGVEKLVEDVLDARRENLSLSDLSSSGLLGVEPSKIELNRVVIA